MAEVVIPGLDDFPLTVSHDLADLPHLLGIETPDVRERNRVHPQLGIAIGDFRCRFVAAASPRDALPSPGFPETSSGKPGRKDYVATTSR
jgi:hypothetical protein